jgi:hypothetical protein
MSSLCVAPSEVMLEIKAIEGPVDVYTWYEGPSGLTSKGALFIRDEIVQPLTLDKRDVKICLYSLKGWDFFRNVGSMDATTPLGDQVNRINNVAVHCFFAASFFQYCSDRDQYESVYDFVCEELPKKGWLLALSSDQLESGKKVYDFFDSKPSLFDCIREMDVKKAYSLMQYIEGYYLVREKVEVFFALPNDEIKYYEDDFVKDVQKMLALDFREVIESVEVNVKIRCFNYGDSLRARPYIDRGKKIKPKDILDYL